VIQWPGTANPRERVTVFELRAGRVQDAMPPSRHPKTGRPYRWMTPPTNGFPPVPEKLLALWRDFENFRRRARNLCPWAEPEPPPEDPRQLRSPRVRTGPSVIAAFNEVHEVAAILKAHGYTKSGKRWKSPHAKPESAPGIVLLGDKVFCHHSDDVLGDERAHDAFDLFCLFNHGGDVRAATKAAAEALGMNARKA
jgi:putative DNA primase/helicase